ncbi:MAG: transcription elongation factor GreA [Zetaproteobacteria bacterium]|nr:MAG: transcription elongation factor GreA [Zetaproteobacteria bacterium]
MQQEPMTLRGAEALRKELEYRKGEKRRRIIAAIEEARAHGDLSENAEYHAAKEEQSLNEGRIAMLEDKLARARIIDPATIESESVVFGATVTLFDPEQECEHTYQIVGVDEADIKENKISITSPIARALIGREVGDVVQVRAPGGAREYEIVAIEYH